MIEAATYDQVCKMSDVSGNYTGIVKSYRWMAPEVLKGEKFDQTADMYSFGAILSELATHQVPFQNVKDDETSISQKVSDGAPKWLISFAKRCLSTKAIDRPPAIEAIALIREVLPLFLPKVLIPARITYPLPSTDPSIELQTRPFGDDMYFKLASNDSTVDFLADPEFLSILQLLRANSKCFGDYLDDKRMKLAMPILISAIPSRKNVKLAFGTQMFSTMMQDPIMMELIFSNPDLRQKLQSLQNDVEKLPGCMDAQMGMVLVFLLQHRPTPFPIIGSLDALAECFRREKSPKNLFGNFVLTPDDVWNGTRNIYRVVDKNKPYKKLLAKLTCQRNEIDVIKNMHMADEAEMVNKYILNCDWDEN
ncbi:Aste57867_20973 [Aphanomyces stellatus]|uniref:Aste57867_20973 protein n=1 Tax=Aphanomyces stellatus TaxID=120398 RepID=A0A485LIE0_9STRA|nr:hypothetical protein As57867_020905 [Aphanomyces stellatus]VFT97649.1 Aste57867_20973 [Aphanomyces stellatus]